MPSSVPSSSGCCGGVYSIMRRQYGGDPPQPRISPRHHGERAWPSRGGRLRRGRAGGALPNSRLLLRPRPPAGSRQDVLIRVAPGIKPSPHTYSQTGQLDAKSGFGREDGLAREAVERVQASERLELVGIHAHIGSQIFELEPYTKTIKLLADFVDFDCRMLNVGGGLGIAYTSEDEPASIEDYGDVKVRGIQSTFDPVPRIMVQPGRSLVGNAGLTIYRIGTIKEIPGVRTYAAVDGGM